jgi:DNA-binding transcriptional MerR regulator
MPGKESDRGPDAEGAPHTIDELTRVTGVPVRTIRFYQSRGALMPPTLRARVAYYGEKHVERLKLIAQLQDRGLRIDAIRDLLTSIDRGELDLAEWLGVEAQMNAPWANDRPRTVSEAELYEIAGSRRPGLIADLERAGLVSRHAFVYAVRSPAQLALATKLEAVGIDFDSSMGASRLLKKHLARAVADLVAHFLARAKDGHLDASDPAALFDALRPAGIEAVRVVFGREMERALRELLASGKAARLPARVGKARSAKRAKT